MSKEIKVYIDSNEDDFITDCYLADNTKVCCEFYHEESEIEYSNCKLLNLQDYVKEKDQQIADLQSQLDQANERLKCAIVPKFKIGQECFYIETNPNQSYKLEDFCGIVEKISVEKDEKGNIIFFYMFDSSFSEIKESNVFTSATEAEKKLQELRGGE